MSSTERVGGLLVSIGIDRRTSMDREFSDYNKKGNHFNQFMGSSSSIGAKTVRNVCVAFRAAAEQNNRAGWFQAFKLQAAVHGGIRVVGSPFEPDGQGTVVSELAPVVPSRYASCYAYRKELEWRVRHTHIVRDVEDSKLIRAGVTLLNERVFHDGRSSPYDFFFMYVTFFTHLFIRVPFTEFQTAVLREVNVAPTQLHPNSWAAVQAFMAMCSAVGVTPTIPVFFYYFAVRPSPSGGWVSFRSVRDRTLFRPFSDSFKNFKQHYFKIIVDKAGLHEFSDGEGRPLFPFYWTRDPRRIRANSIGDLTARDLEAVRTINTLPRRISARHLVECLSLEDCGPKAFELMTTPGPRKSNFLTIRKKSGASSSTARPTSVPKVPRPPPAGASTGRVPPTDKAGGSGVKVSGSSLPPELAAVQVGPTSGAAMTSADPTRKRKDPTAEGRKDKEGSSSRSASKKARKDKGKEKDRERVLAVPLPGGVFSPDFSMSDRTKFHMSSSQRALIEPLSELELTNAMLEMSTRTSALAWYLRNFADRPGVAEVRAELDREKKNAASLQVTLEEMVLNQDEYDKRIEQLEADLAKTNRESAERLAAARIEQERLAEESRQKIDLLEAEVTRVKEAESCRARANEELTLEVAKAKEQIAELESTILFEHEEGFNKALRQVTLLAGVQDPFALGVDIEKDVFNGVLVDLNAAEENEPTAEAAGGGKN
ncbi:histidine-containing phosphotransfer protein [Vigna angularis]|uniref:Histidine-containing phosphotransfer protein n=1 Tax=Phaseolus angularis TaxID=3914 RepID=A0A8T0JVL7_PHAAN|nr:histidine-containing phosphotransfer protein [Vigna angularis]